MFRRAGLVALLSIVAAPALAQSGDPSFRVVNNTRKVVNEVYASPASESNWGHDRLGNEIIRPGGTQIIRLPGGECVYDIRVVYQDNSAEERRNVNTCNLTDFVLGGGAAPQQQPQRQDRSASQANPSFNLVNQSGRVIEQFYASPSTRDDWGEDRLGDDVVNPGRSYPIRLPQGECAYDLRWVFQGGGEAQRRNVNTCTVTNFTVR